MTYIEAIREDLQPFPVSSKMITRRVEKKGLKASDEISDEDTALLIGIEILSRMISLSSVKEGGGSKSFNIAGAKLLLRQLCSEVGVNITNYLDIPTVKFL